MLTEVPQDHLLSITDAIDERLGYFQELEHATRMLNHPGDSLVLQTEFLYMVERVDVCIEYLKAHVSSASVSSHTTSDWQQRHFREAEIYLLRFQQCMTRAMTLIKMFFVGSLKALTVDVTKRMGEKDVSVTAQTHLLYTRFYTVSAQLAPLLAELERRAAAHPDELMSLLSECHAAYFAARKGLLVSRLQEEIKGLDPTRTELVELVRVQQFGDVGYAHRLEDKDRVQLLEATLHRRIQPFSCFLQFRRRSALVRSPLTNVPLVSHILITAHTSRVFVTTSTTTSARASCTNRVSLRFVRSARSYKRSWSSMSPRLGTRKTTTNTPIPTS